jgi:hypothetical protein
MGLDKKKKVFKLSMDIEADEKARALNPPKSKKKKRSAFDMKQALKILGGMLAFALLLFLIGWYDVFFPPAPKFTPVDEAQKAQMAGQHAQVKKLLSEPRPTSQ